MKIERHARTEPGFTKDELEVGGIYLQTDEDDDFVFIVTDEDTYVYISTGSQYNMTTLDSTDRFHQVKAKLVIE